MTQECENELRRDLAKGGNVCKGDIDTIIDAYKEMMKNKTGDAPVEQKLKETSVQMNIEIVETVEYRHKVTLDVPSNLINATDVLENLIRQSIWQSQDEKTAHETGLLIEQIYQDGAGLGMLGEWLKDPTVVEININGYEKGSIQIIREDKTEYLDADKCFNSPKTMMDTVKMMVSMGGMSLGAICPRVEFYLQDGTGISAYIPPLASVNDGAVASINKNSSSMIHERLIEASYNSRDYYAAIEEIKRQGFQVISEDRDEHGTAEGLEIHGWDDGAPAFN